MTRFQKTKHLMFLAVMLTVILVLPGMLKAEIKPRLKKQISDLQLKLKNDPDNVELLMELAKRYGWANMQHEAIETYEKVLEVDPGNIEAMKSLKDFYGWTKQPDKSLAMMEKIIALDPDDIELKKDLAKRYVWAKKQKKAIEVYEEIVKAEPEDVDSRKRLSNLYRWNKMNGKAVEQYAILVGLDNDDLETKERLAFAYSWGGHPEKAIELFEELLEQDPENHKARKQLAHLYYYNDRQAEAIREYKKLIDSGILVTEQDRIDAYGKMGQASTRLKDFQAATQYYKEILSIAPGSLQAQEWLEEVRRAQSPQIFSEFYHQKVKGDDTRVYQKYGFSTPLEYGYSMEASYAHLRRTEPSERRVVTQRGDIQINKDFKKNLSLFIGAGMLYYGPDETVRSEWFARLIKKFNDRVRTRIEYWKRAEDSDWDKLEQNVDRHRFTTSLQCDIVEDLIKVNTFMWCDYLTKGNARSDNWGMGFGVTPILILIKEPSLNVSYTYFRADYLRQDNDSGRKRGGVFEYFNPRLYYTHSAAIFYSQAFFEDRVRFTFSNRLYFVQDEEDVNYWGHGMYLEVRWKMTDRDTVTFGYNRPRQIWHVQDSYQMVDRYTVRYSHDF